MSWTEHTLYFLDFEGSRVSGVLEYGVVTLKAGKVDEVRTRLCRATGRIRAEDTAVHGLKAETVAAEAPLSADWEYFAQLRERGVLAAHYAGVENALLKEVWPFPRPSPDFIRTGGTVLNWGPWIDSARIYAQLYPGLNSGRLEALVAAAGLQAELDALAASRCPPERRSYHCALYDALAGALLLEALARDPQGFALSLGQLLTLSTLDPIKREGLTQAELW